MVATVAERAHSRPDPLIHRLRFHSEQVAPLIINMREARFKLCQRHHLNYRCVHVHYTCAVTDRRERCSCSARLRPSTRLAARNEDNEKLENAREAKKAKHLNETGLNDRANHRLYHRANHRLLATIRGHGTIHRFGRQGGKSLSAHLPAARPSWAAIRSRISNKRSQSH